MAKTILLRNGKGGTGKSTLCISLYFAFVNSDVQTLIIDTDPQKSIINLNKQVGNTINVIDKLDTKQIQANGLTIIDSAGNWDAGIKKGIDIADIILIPFKPSGLDAMALVQTVRQIREYDPKKEMYAVLNMAIPSTDFNDEIIEILKTEKIQVLNSKVGNRIAFGKIVFTDGSIYKSGNKKAKEEINALAMEIYGKLIKK